MGKRRPTRAPHSAGILLYRGGPPVEVLLIKPGGPYWQRRDQGAWMIPKGTIEAGEAPVDAALREFEEETGSAIRAVPAPLCIVRQAGGKIVEAFAVEGDFDPAQLNSAEFEMEWPPRSGTLARFPEVIEARWFGLDETLPMMLKSQLPMIDALRERLAARS